MASYIKRGESLFIPFKNGESIYDSQLKPRMYKTKDLYDRFSYHFAGAEMVEYAEVVRCKDCTYAKPYERIGGITGYYCQNKHSTFLYGLNWERLFEPVREADDFCSYGERREGE